MKYVVITGMSTGIGYDAGKTLIQKGFHVLGSVRKQADADRLKQELGEDFTPLLFDVTDQEAVRAGAAQVKAIVGDTGLAGLVNNAGIAIAGPLMHLTLDEIRWQFEVNVFGLISVTQTLLPLLGARKPCPHPPGRIVNISSVSGKVTFPFFGAYAGSKHAVEAFTDALRRELMIYGIDVIAIGPGSVKTPIWEKKGGITEGKFMDTDYAYVVKQADQILREQDANGMPVSVVSHTILEALTAPQPKPRYALYDSFIQRVATVLPKRLFDKLAAKQVHLID